MKFLAASAALLATTALAAPSSLKTKSALRFATRQTCDGSTDPSTGAVQNAINSWFNDVVAVNAFLNNPPAPGSAGLAPAAQQTLASANDEPVELGILASICELNSPGVPDYQGAVNTLMSVFPDVPARLQDIVNNAGDAATVHADIDGINHDRCCFVLPSVDTLFVNAASDYGLVGTVPISVPRPNACASISC